MKLLDHLQVKSTGIRRVDEFRQPFLDVDLKRTDALLDHEPYANEEYALTATVRVVFCANRAQLESATRRAEKVLLSRLYDGVLSELQELRLAISNGDRTAAFAAAREIERVITGE